MSAQEIITQHLDIWTAAHKTRSTAGRGSNNKLDLVGIKKLRELILELAVRGKLVPQDPNDEPASELLKRITAEKRKLVHEGKIKTEKPLAEILDEEKLFELPSGWEWCRLNKLVTLLGDGLHGTPDYDDAGNYYFVNGNNLKNGAIDIKADTKKVNEQQYLKHKKELNSKTVLVSINGTLGNVAFYNNEPIMLGKSACYFNLCTGLSKPFIKRLIESPYFINYAFGSATGSTIKNLGLGAMNSFPIALPSSSEQHRIVAKVDELMAFCDQLEQTQSDNIAAHAQLVEALLATLTNSSDHNELQNNWQRIAAHFDTFFTTEHSIDQLKQTILQLAVMGKLAPQDPNDEPASELLKKIAAEKAQLIKEGKIKKEKPLLEITEEEKPFELPSGWEFVRLNKFSILKGGFAYQSSKFSESGVHQVIRMGNIRPDFLRIDEKPVFITDEYASITADYKLEVNDILLTMTGTKNKRDYLYSVAINNDHLHSRQLYLNQRLCAIKALHIDTKFLSLCLKNETLLDAIFAKSTGTANQANIGMEAISCWAIPIAPLEEQHRIVAKVDELMVLCDALKNNLQNAQVTQLALADALVEQAVG